MCFLQKAMFNMKLVEMEDINPEFSTCDVVIVLGANDVVNPAAKEDPSSPMVRLF